MSKAVLKMNPTVKYEYMTKLGNEIDIGDVTVLLTRQGLGDRSVYILSETEKIGPLRKSFFFFFARVTQREIENTVPTW